MPPMQLRLTTIGGASLRTSSQHWHECTTKSMKSAKVPELFPSDHDELRRWPEARRESLAPGAVAANFHEGSATSTSWPRTPISDGQPHEFSISSRTAPR